MCWTARKNWRWRPSAGTATTQSSGHVDAVTAAITLRGLTLCSRSGPLSTVLVDCSDALVQDTRATDSPVRPCTRATQRPDGSSRRALRPTTMASICARLFRTLRSVIVPTSAIIGFSCLLTFFLVLYQPTRGPEAVQRLGWQAWAVVSPLVGDQAPISGGGLPTSPIPEGADWWNVTTAEPVVDTANLPLDVWAPLLPHDTGCAYMIIHPCTFR
jgi:hypothetical protein